MENNVNKKLVIPFITALGFIAISVNSVFKGIDQHQTWRIVLASAGGLLFVVLTALIIKAFIKNGKTTAEG
jgi:hypothetical protein